MIASTRDMPLSRGMDMNWGPEGEDTSSSHISSASCHRQLECSTGMTEGVSDRMTTSPHLSQHHPSPSTCLLVEPPTSSNPPVRANQSVETNGEELPGSEDAAGAALSKATSHLLSLSHHRHYRPPLWVPATLSAGGERGTLQGLLCYQHAPALKWAGPESGLCLLEGISLVVCVSLR